ncbi:MAG: dockerin type I domain-containing protein [Candidatus Bipolaricaulota bacterium]
MNSNAVTRKPLYCLLIGFITLAALGQFGYGVNISNIEFRLKNEPGSTSNHDIVVTNDENSPVDISVELGDWYRKPDGANSFIGENAARWRAPGYVLTEGESLTVTYRTRVRGEFNQKFTIQGDVSVSRPEAGVRVHGDVGYSPASQEVSTEQGAQEGPVSVRRSINPEPGKGEDGLSLKVSVEITANEEVRGITLSERFPVNTKVTNLESGGIPVEYVNRSAADWIDVDAGEFSLEPGESRRIPFSVLVPRGVNGTHWASIYVKSEPAAQDREGTTIVAIKRFAVKVYVTVPGTDKQEAYVTDFSAITRSIPKFELALENRGNVELEISGELRLRDETGEVVDSIEISSFELLPGYRRELTIEGEGATNLSPGKYNALAVLDYGGENKIGKSLSFRVKPLDLQPVGSSPSLPKDPDGDGLYEDIDGNGSLERIDALVFSFNFDKDSIQKNGRAFDFNLDGRVNMKDAEELMELVQSS